MFYKKKNMSNVDQYNLVSDWLNDLIQKYAQWNK